MTLARVLIVEDDPSVSRFIAEALTPLEQNVEVCHSVEAAREALQAKPAQLVLTDLSFPGESGLALIRSLRAQPATRVVVFSGGLHQAVREQLAQAGVFRSLSKPASARELVQVVREALNMADWPDAPHMETTMSNSDLQPFELAAIETYFDGDRTFYETFRDSCAAQFAVDLAAGDQACAAGDAVALRRTAHSLKSVLQTLGYADHSMCAKAVEQAAQQSPMAEAVAGWQDLRQRLVSSFKLAL